MSPDAAEPPPVPGAAPGGSVRLPEPAAPRASIVVSAWKSAPRLLRCLGSIAERRAETAFEVVVAVNEPTPDLLAELEAHVQGARVISFPVNLGFGPLCNRGAAAGRGEFVVLLNDDLEVEPGWLDKLVEVADADPVVGAVGGANYDPDGTLQELGAIIWADGLTTMVDEDVVRRLEDRVDFSKPRRVDYCGAAAFLVRRSTWDALGGFDEGYYPAYFEDVDLCLRIAQLGQSVMIQPQSRVVHHRGSSSTTSFREYVAAGNRGRFLERWTSLLADHEPFHPEDPGAVSTAIERAASADPQRTVTGLLDLDRPPAPRASGDTSEFSPEEERQGLRAQLELMSGYAGHLEQRDVYLADQLSQWRTVALSRWARALATETEFERAEHELAELRQAGAVEAGKLRDLVEHFQRERAELRQQIDELRGSSSWRLTKPLRWLSWVAQRARDR